MSSRHDLFQLSDSSYGDSDDESVLSMDMQINGKKHVNGRLPNLSGQFLVTGRERMTPQTTLAAQVLALLDPVLGSAPVVAPTKPPSFASPGPYAPTPPAVQCTPRSAPTDSTSEDSENGDYYTPDGSNHEDDGSISKITCLSGGLC